ncbi:MAG: nuclear transport factor 2 family protein [Acidobacteriaceae bacterium]|nr:nuclear transport factor 2 family protein [Acidobacteriaceae bacterium]
MLRESVERLIAMVEEGKYLEAIQEFYAEDASMQENNDPPRVGLANLLAREQQFLNSIREMQVHRAESYVADGNRAAIHWIFESTDREGKKHRLDEVAYQLWERGKIIRERFYYDPAQRQIEI